jgi:hypothetical protein
MSPERSRILNFFKKLFSRRSDSSLFWVYVQCDHCGEKLHTHVNLHHDLSIRYGATEKDDVYFTRKRIIGRDRCFKPIEIELTFDSQRRLVDRQIQGGQFISLDEFPEG